MGVEGLPRDSEGLDHTASAVLSRVHGVVDRRAGRQLQTVVDGSRSGKGRGHQLPGTRFRCPVSAWVFHQ